MASPPAAAAGNPADAEPLEVCCAGCGETLEVDRGLTEFICPDCATPQSLPPELMPPPPPRRKALPLPRGAADLRGARLPCGSCGALLSVPVGLPRCACPLCGAELAIDTARLRHYLLSSAAAVDAVPVYPLGASSPAPPILQAREAHSERQNHLIPEQAESKHYDYMVGREEVHGVNKDTARCKEQRNICSYSSRIITAETRYGDALNQVRHQAQDLSSSHAVLTEQTEQPNKGSPDRVTALCRELECIAHIDDAISTDINGACGHSVRPKSLYVYKRNMQTPKQMMQKPLKQLSCNVTSLEHARAESPNRVIDIQENQQELGNEANHRQTECTHLASGTVADDNNKGRTRQAVYLNARSAEKRQVQTTKDATQPAEKAQSDSVIHRELDSQVTLAENEQPGRQGIQMRKRKGLISASNSGLQLRCSKRLAKDLSAAIDRQPVLNTEQIHRQTARCQTASPNDFMPVADKQRESEPDEQWTASPVRSSSGPPDTDRIINNFCTNLSRHEIPETSSNELENLHSTTPPSSNADMSNPEHFNSNPDMSNPEHFSSNPDMSDPEHFARTYIPMDVRRALAKLASKYQLNSDETYLHGSMDSKGRDPELASQNKGRRPRGLTLHLKVWTMPKGMRIPVSLNASGEPIGKEAATLSAFLGTLARDGILAPLAYLSWKCVPENNKDVMCHIVKLKFDIAPVGELWIVKNLGRKWRSWKFHLKKHHFDSHKTQEECLADRNPRVLEEQWRFLVAYWSTETAQAASARNKASGMKSFARVVEEEKQKRPNKDAPGHEDLFILTHTPKDGRPMTKAAADAIVRFREQCQKQTEGTGRSDSGQESCPNGRWRRTLKASLKEAMEAKRRAEDEAAALRQKLLAMEEGQKKLQKDTANVRRTRRSEPSSPPGFPKILRTGYLVPVMQVQRTNRLGHSGVVLRPSNLKQVILTASQNYLSRRIFFCFL